MCSGAHPNARSSRLLEVGEHPPVLDAFAAAQGVCQLLQGRSHRGGLTIVGEQVDDGLEGESKDSLAWPSAFLCPTGDVDQRVKECLASCS